MRSIIDLFNIGCVIIGVPPVEDNSGSYWGWEKVLQRKESLTWLHHLQAVSYFLLHQKRLSYNRVVQYLVKQWKLTITEVEVNQKWTNCCAIKIVKEHYNWKLSVERNIRSNSYVHHNSFKNTSKLWNKQLVVPNCTHYSTYIGLYYTYIHYSVSQ